MFSRDSWPLQDEQPAHHQNVFALKSQKAISSRPPIPFTAPISVGFAKRSEALN